MTSILTNVAAMAALQTLRAINDSLEETQNHVSSGYRVEKAADNAAYWSIATTMRSDNKALSAVSDALGLGAAKVDTAYSAMDSAVDVVTEIKAKLVAATEKGVDRTKIQEEIKQLQAQLLSIAQSASFSGENWVAGNETKSVVSSFVRDGNGNTSVTTTDYKLELLVDRQRSVWRERWRNRNLVGHYRLFERDHRFNLLDGHHFLRNGGDFTRSDGRRTRPRGDDEGSLAARVDLDTHPATGGFRLSAQRLDRTRVSAVSSMQTWKRNPAS